MPTSDCAERSGTQTPLTGYIWPGNRREDGSEDQYTPRPPSASRPPSARPSSSSRPSSAPMSSRSRSVRHSIKVFLSEQRMDAPDTVLAAVNNNDVLMSFFLHIRNQQAGLAALREECADLEEQQRVLWRQVMPADHRRILHAGTRVKHDDGDAAGAGSPLLAAGSSVALQTADDDNNTNNNNNIIPECDFIDEATDEFDDIYVNHARQCRYKGGKIFKYGEPDIPGHFTEVPVDGGEHFCGLYQNMTEEGVWSFYNDSLRYIMQVKYRFLATSMVAAGPHATCTRLPSGEVDISVTVLPEETQILFYGEAGDYQNLSTAVPVDGNYKNAHVEKHNAAIAGHMQRTAAQRRKSAFEYVTPSEVLQLCDSIPATAGREGVLFVDPEFPPGRESLCGPMTSANAPFFSLPWRRPEEYLPAKDAADVRLFRGLVLPCDACPGDGHDLYLCSAAAILAEQPHCVRSLFRHPAGGEVGKRQRARRAYHITLNIGGWWSPTILDDYVPASKIGPEFGRCEMDLRKLWYPLLQKGYAKMYGSYAAIQCINSNNNNYNSSTSTKESNNNNNSRNTINNNSCILSALEDLSGFPTRSIDAAWRAEKQREEGLFRGAAVVRTDAAAEDGYGNHLLSELSDALYRGHSVFLRLPDSGPATSKAARMGLVYGMGYAVLDLVQYHDTQLVQLRCPTAVPDWDGLWCPESIRWRQDPMLTERCGMSGGDALTECVWLDWSEALTMFAGGGICYTALGREDYRVKGQFRENKEASCGRTIPSVVLEVTVTQPVRAYCILSQPACVGQPEQELTPLLLAVSHTVPGGGDTQRVLGVATRNPNISRKTLEFVPERQLAMQVDFVPGGGPYYILPRSQQGSQQQHGSMAYTLGFLPDRPVDGAALKVRFVRPNPQTCKFFTCEDTMEFAAASLSEATADSVYYQHRDAVGLLVSKAGDSIMI